MQKTKPLFYVVFLVSFSAKAQFSSFEAIEAARKEGNIKKLITIWQDEFSRNPASGTSAYFLAQSYAYDRQTDSAFKYLFIQLQLDSNAMAPSDDVFLYLRSDTRWKDVEDKIIRYAAIRFPGALKDVEQTKMLWKMLASDQQYYYEIELADQKLGKNNPVSNALWDVKKSINKHNANALDSIIAIKGWPKISQIGYIGANAAFLVVQHADLERQKKYLPIIKKLCEEKEAQWPSYALMYDRVKVSENKPQLYGSQLILNEKTGKYEFSPIEDEKNVDKRRAEMGLGTLAEYAKRFGLEYVPK